MKKLFKVSLLALAGMLTFSFASCSDDDNSSSKTPEVSGEIFGTELEDNFIYVSDATYQAGQFPQATTQQSLGQVDMSEQVMNGSINFITVTSPTAVSKFFLGITGVDGYLVYDPNVTKASSDEYTYTIPMMMAQNYEGDSELVLSAELEDGEVTIPSYFPLTQIETKDGVLEIKLAFSNEKDVDLHLFTPSGMHIYYGTSYGGYYYGPLFASDWNEDWDEDWDDDDYWDDEYEETVYPFGLDVDSNAGCSLDYINKENIYIPSEYLENGVYTVAVDLYSNCDPSIATTWSITARYKGNLLAPITGQNPAFGEFEIGAPSSYSDYLVEVMKFRISDANRSKVVLDPAKALKVKRSALRLSKGSVAKMKALK